MLTSNRTWLVSKDILERSGFAELISAPPSFQLMVARFGSGPSHGDNSQSTALRTGSEASLPQNWEERARAFGRGLTILRTPQCPYVENATSALLSFAEERGIKAKVVEFKTAQEVQKRSPSAYGAFGIVLNGRFLAYSYLSPKDFDKLMLERSQGD
jgi:hypothetical protein